MCVEAAADRADAELRRTLGVIRSVNAADGRPVCVHEYGGGPRSVIIGHPMGYNGPVMGPLANCLRGYRCSVPDLRGHGGTAVAPGYQFPATSLAMDILGCAAAVPPGTVGVGHSLGAAALLLAEALQPGTFQALYLYEPAIMPAEVAATRITRDSASISRMLRRRRSFGSREEAYAHYARRAPLSGFVADALRGYVEHGFEDDASGGVTLTSRPEYAVGISLGGIAAVAFDRLPAVQCPVLVARGTAPNPVGRAGFEADVVDRLADARLELLEGLDHFGPQTAPHVVARSILDFLR